MRSDTIVKHNCLTMVSLLITLSYNNIIPPFVTIRYAIVNEKHRSRNYKIICNLQIPTVKNDGESRDQYYSTKDGVVEKYRLRNAILNLREYE